MNSTPHDNQESTRSRSRRQGARRGATAALVLATAGALTATGAITLASGASAADRGTSASSANLKLPKAPPAGKAWLQGVLTDQAGHALDNVNVEVWPNDPAATEPIASNLTYAGTSARQQHGVYRVEVPMNQPYRLAFSAIGGKEDGDAFRTRWYAGGRAIQARVMGRAAGPVQAKAAGRVRDLGTTPLVHQGHVASHAKAAREKTRVGKKPVLKVRVTSHFVSNPTGKVVVKVKHHKVTRRLSAANHGKIKVRLPKIHRTGKFKATVRYLGSGTVKPSKTHTKVVVKRRKK